MSPLQTIAARQRTFQMLADGEGVVLCMALGDRAGADRYRLEMEAQRAALDGMLRQVEEEGGCYFDAAGEMSRMQAEARSAINA